MGCSCLLLLVAAVITGIVLLILNWSAVVSFFGGSDSTKAQPKPKPSAGGPCPKSLAAQLPKGSASGAKLVAAYSRETVKERYAFCRTKAGKLYYYFEKKPDKQYVGAEEVAKTKNGYTVRLPPYTYRFGADEITAYKNGKESWKEKLIPESSIG